MPKYLVPSTPDTLPLFIADNEKLDALGLSPEKDELDAIRVLLYTNQEERVISDEELQEWKRLEKKVLENQNTYKKNTESLREFIKHEIPLILLWILPISFSVRVLRFMFAAECHSNPFTLFDRWPIDLIVFAIYLYHFHGSELRLKQGTPDPVQPEVIENEEEDNDDDWEGSMTSTELQSRQKALVRKWEPIMQERVERLDPSGWLFFARLLIMFYFVIHVCNILDCLKPRRQSRLPLPTGEFSLFFAELTSTILIIGLLLIQCLMEPTPSKKKSQ
ncbi:unnamed protein product [Caenorhabditis brenneri]